MIDPKRISAQDANYASSPVLGAASNVKGVDSECAFRKPEPRAAQARPDQWSSGQH